MSDNPYTYCVKQIADLAKISDRTIVRRLQMNRRVLGVRIRFVKDEGRGTPYRIHEDSVRALKMRLAS